MEPYSSDDIKKKRRKNFNNSIEEKMNNFLDITEKMMVLILRIPDLIEKSLRNIDIRINNIQNQIDRLETLIRDIDNENEKGQ